LKWMSMILGLIFLAGCASPAKKACLQTDWRKLGYEEGENGKGMDSSLSRRLRCQNEGVPPDMARYEQGRRQGLERYCTASNGRTTGAKGMGYPNVCPPDLEASFKAAYLMGLQSHVHELSAEINRLTEKRDSLRHELTDVLEQMGYLKKEVAQIGPGQERVLAGMISEMRWLESSEQSLSLQIDALGMDLDEMRRQLLQMKKQADHLSK